MVELRFNGLAPQDYILFGMGVTAAVVSRFLSNQEPVFNVNDFVTISSGVVGVITGTVVCDVVKRLR